MNQPFSYVICVACGEPYRGLGRDENPPDKCVTCSASGQVRRMFSPEGPYTGEEFGDLVDRRMVRFAQGDRDLILNRLLATVACGVARRHRQRRAPPGPIGRRDQRAGRPRVG